MNETYLIAEMGQNHNGQVSIAKSLIEIISSVNSSVSTYFGSHSNKGFNAVKTTIRDLEYEMAPSEYNKPYIGINSFGKTYRAHRESLELSHAEHYELFRFAKEHSLDFITTLCAPQCLDILELFTPDYLKVASRDLTNIPLLDLMASTRIPIIISTGMSDMEDIYLAVNTITKYHTDLSILHCNSIYPPEPQQLNLRSIQYLSDSFPNFRIGYSDHSVGILIPPVAVAMGAKIIEKHVTISRRLRGSDQQGSLSEDGMFRMLRDTRIVEESLGIYSKSDYSSSESARKKLQRSLCASKDLPEGTILSTEDLALISPGTGVPYKNRELLIGKQLTKAIKRHEIIYMTNVRGLA